MDLHQPSGVGPVASAYGMNQQQHTSAFSDYFSEHPQYADGDMHDGEGNCILALMAICLSLAFLIQAVKSMWVYIRPKLAVRE